MSAGSNNSLSLFKIKSQALSHTVLTLKHCGHCTTFIYEEIKKDIVTENQTYFIHSEPWKIFLFFFFMTYCVFSMMEKDTRKDSSQKLIGIVLPTYPMFTWTNMQYITNFWGALCCTAWCQTQRSCYIVSLILNWNGDQAKMRLICHSSHSSIRQTVIKTELHMH